jgi:hypothetical protein
VLRRTLAEIEKALCRSCNLVATRRAAPAERSVRASGQTLSDAVLAGDVRRVLDPVPSSRVPLPPRVLDISARPIDLPEINVRRERDDITTAFSERLAPGSVHIEWLRQDRRADLAKPSALIDGTFFIS